MMIILLNVLEAWRSLGFPSNAELCVCVSVIKLSIAIRGTIMEAVTPPEPPSSPSLCAYSGSVSFNRQLFEMVRDKEKKETLSLIRFFSV
jgi:hypothetical protein